MTGFYKIPVKEITKETKKAVSVVFDIPEDLRSKFKFIPGQYITIQKEIENDLLRRAYSICSSPNSDEFKVAVKEVARGSFSVFANRILKVGDILEISAPEGRFILETSGSNKKNYLAMVAGSGITPVLSMIKSVLETEEESTFILVYGNKSSDETIFKNEIDRLAIDHKDRFKVHYVYSQILSDLALSGRIDRNITMEIVKNKYGHLSFDEYFLCGPETMIEQVRGAISGYGVNESFIRYELFSSPLNKEDLKQDLSGNSKITVLLDEEESSFDMAKDELILNIALVNGLDAPYSCQGGICSSCLARVVEGEVVMDKNTILNKDEVEEGLILTCQAHPVSAAVKIDYDDI